MESAFFIKGLIFGFSIAAPVGPIGVLCLHRSLAGGWRAGLTTGMGAATADALYGCVAVFGLAGITGLMVSQKNWIQFIGGVFLIYLGLTMIGARNKVPQNNMRALCGATGYLSALLLTLTNPMTILSFTAVFAGMGLGADGNASTAAGWLVSGVFCGSMAWWTILSSASSYFNRHLNSRTLSSINLVSGMVLTLLGITAITGQL